MLSIIPLLYQYTYNSTIYILTSTEYGMSTCTMKTYSTWRPTVTTARLKNTSTAIWLVKNPNLNNNERGYRNTVINQFYVYNISFLCTPLYIYCIYERTIMKRNFAHSFIAVFDRKWRSGWVMNVEMRVNILRTFVTHLLVHMGTRNPSKAGL